MADGDKLYLVLGCNGLESDGFVSCSGTENRILEVHHLLEGYDEIMDYFDVLRLFDRPLIEFNAVRNCMFKMQDKFDQKFKRLWSINKFQLMEKYIVTHKSCGLYLNLILVAPEFEISAKPDEIILVKAG